MYNSLKTLKTEINSEKIDKLIPLFFFPELLPSFKDTINNIGIVVITDYTSSIAYVHHKGEVASVIIIDSVPSSIGDSVSDYTSVQEIDLVIKVI